MLVATLCRVLYHVNVALPRSERALQSLGECRLTSIVLRSHGASSERVLRHVGRHGTIERVRCDYGRGNSSMAVVRACTVRVTVATPSAVTDAVAGVSVE